jgi:hypothetical protein
LLHCMTGRDELRLEGSWLLLRRAELIPLCLLFDSLLQRVLMDGLRFPMLEFEVSVVFITARTVGPTYSFLSLLRDMSSIARSINFLWSSNNVVVSSVHSLVRLSLHARLQLIVL